MNIPFVDLYAQYKTLKNPIDQAIQGVLDNTAFIGGAAVREFETSFAEKVGAKHCIGVGNGTDAIQIVLKMLGIGHGDEVITTATSWIATSEMVTITGAKPVFVDIEPDFYCIDSNKLEAAITPKTRAIIPVHLYGQIANMGEILTIAKKHNLYVIEDCAQSHLSEWQGRKAGTMGIAGTFSFYPGKNLGAYGDAGCIVTDDDELASKCRQYSNHGQLTKNTHLMEGINSRLDGIQAAILNVKLPHLEQWCSARGAVAAKYSELLAGINEIELPKIRENSRHTFHIYAIRTRRRDELIAALDEAGISSGVHYPHALPTMPAYEYLNLDLEDYQKAIHHSQSELSLPIYPEMTDEMIEYVAETIRGFFKE
ncbi:DegT/DnrJ/EryC1/StrS family aminotransferase [bacterium]|nr:DegT/DnrJ/EryC1/StrS family aminotransferase [bacterium]